ncbi:MAG: polyribonucleotide nucleotidyltransferase [Candidatus Paceibacteria bacterium]
MNTQSFSVEIAGKTITADITDLAGQANGSVLMRSGDTTILVTAVMSEDEQTNLPYFPLSVEFEERFYAAGAILGSRFMRREGRPSEEAILSARIIDRTIRPLFDHTLRREIQIVVTVLAIGEDDPDVLAVIGSSLALAISDIPWTGPVGAVRIGRERENGRVIINPTYVERAADNLDFEILACGKGGTVNMIETAAGEISEEDVIAVLEATTIIHSQLETFQQSIVQVVGKQKVNISKRVCGEDIISHFREQFSTRLYETLFSGRAGKGHLHNLKDEFLTSLPSTANKNQAGDYFEERINEHLHQGALLENKRPDGRDFDTVRPLFAQAGGISPVLHGSGIFYRGDTHIFSALTLGGPNDALTIDSMEVQIESKRFMHHYNFPPFSVGETGRVGGFNRRMVGHGALAEKALYPVIPKKVNFPYTIRLVSETLSSNGSSSMGSVCASTLALLDGGVPLLRPVAGIASGAMIDGGKYKILTDIQGPEDEHGDMDLKVAGTSLGITAIQMDVKVNGVTLEILSEALEKAKQARLKILSVIEKTIPSPRPNISPRAPEIIVLTIKPEQIGLVIGSGGKTINKIKEQSGVKEITIEDDGVVFITGTNGSAQNAAGAISAITKIYEVGEEVEVTITRLTTFGAFAKLDEYNEGLIHISEIAPFRLEKIEGLLTEGEKIKVAIMKIEDGKIGLSIKKVDPEFVTRKGIVE